MSGRKLKKKKPKNPNLSPWTFSLFYLILKNQNKQTKKTPQTLNITFVHFQSNFYFHPRADSYKSQVKTRQKK